MVRIVNIGPSEWNSCLYNSWSQRRRNVVR